MRVAGLVVLGLLATIAGRAAAQDGDVGEGHEFAQRVCTACHAVELGEASPRLGAPTFTAIANVPGMTRTALIVALRTPHREMPDLVLDRDALSNVAAYILTFQAKN